MLTGQGAKTLLMDSRTFDTRFEGATVARSQVDARLS